MRRFLIAIAVTGFIIAPAFGQGSSALISEALDKQIKLDIAAKTPLPQIIQTIANDTGVRIEASPDVWETLPWGEQTAIAAKIENQTLRQALEALTRKLGLTFELRDEYIELHPVPALRRLGRRATLDELNAMDLLTSTPYGGSGDPITCRDLVAAIDSKLAAAKSATGYAVENRAFTDPTDATKISVPRNATLMDALEAISQNTPATWYPWGKTIVVLPKPDAVRMLLGKPITIRLDGVDVAQVVPELSQRAGVPFTIEPGALTRVPPETRNIKLTLQEASIQSALEALAGATGLAYTVNDRGVYIWNPSTGAAPGQREPTLGIMQLDNGMQILIRESQMPADVREYLKSRTDKQIEKIRQMMKQEGFKPTTKPAATRPDENL